MLKSRVLLSEGLVYYPFSFSTWYDFESNDKHNLDFLSTSVTHIKTVLLFADMNLIVKATMSCVKRTEELNLL